MKIIWADPQNICPHYLNLMAIVLREAGHDVVVCSVASPGRPLPHDVRWVPFMHYRSPPFGFKSDAFTTLWALVSHSFGWLRAIRCARAAGVSALLVTTDLKRRRLDTWGMRLMARRGLAPVVIVQRPYNALFNDPAGKQASRYLEFYQSAARILIMSRFTRQWMAELYPTLPEDRYLQFDFPHFKPLMDRCSANEELAGRLRDWASGAPVIAFLSNMPRERGLNDLLSCLPTMDSKLADWRLLLISTGGTQDQIAAVRHRIAELGFQERVWAHFDRYSTQDFKAYLEAASVIVTPYHIATESSVIGFAAGAGVPVVATDVGGLPELIRPGVNGELAPRRNPPLLAEAIAGVVNRLEHYRNGARACRETMYSLRQAVAVIEHALRDASKSNASKKGNST